MFESRSSDGIFLGYALHSRAYRVLNLETNRVMETCEVTFDETMLCSSSVFECAGNEELGKSIFVEEEDDADWGVSDPPPRATPIDPSTSTSAHGPEPSTTTSWGPIEPPLQSKPAVPEEAPAHVEGKATLLREAPQHIQRRHPHETMIGDID